MKIKQKNVNFIENIIFITLLHETSAKYFHFSLTKKILISFSFGGALCQFLRFFHTYMYDVLQEYAYLRIYMIFTNNSKITETKPLLPPIK